jgi:MYXO-CTERM domain-containing protein
MRKSFALGSFAVAAAIAFPFSAHGAEWHQGAPAHRSISSNPSAAARSYLSAHAAQLRIDGVDLEQRRVLPLRSLRTVRYAQRHGKLPVVGKSAMVRVGPDGTVRVVVLDVARNLTVSTVPTIDRAQAIADVTAFLGQPSPSAHAHTSLVVLPYEDVGGVLAWHVDVLLRQGMHRFVVDAHRGGVVQHHSLARDALGRVWEVNPIVTPSLSEHELTDLTPTTPTSLTGFEGAMTVRGYVSGDLLYGSVQTKQTAPSEGEDFLFTPNLDAWSGKDPFGEVMGYYHAARIRTFFEETLGVDMTGNEYSLTVVTGYAPESSPEYTSNAFYSPWPPSYPGLPGNPRNVICLGRGHAENLSHDSDVLLHEFTHYMSHNALDYADSGDFDAFGYAAMPGAINEGTADYFSSTLNNEPQVGEYALGQWARNLDEPAGRCPDNVFGESHEDGKLVGSTGWALRKSFGSETADQLVWGAMSLLGNRATLGDFGKGLVQTAKDLDLDASQISQIEAVLAERGLDDCDRALEVNGKPRTTYVLGLGELGAYMGSSCGEMKDRGVVMSSLFQFVYTPSPDDTSLTLDFDLTNAWGGSDDLDWRVLIRRDQMVTVSPSGGLPVVSAPDYGLFDITTNHAQVVIDATSEPAFDPSVRYYAVVLSESCPTTSLRVAANPPEEVIADAGADAAPEAGLAEGGLDLRFDSAAEDDLEMTAELQPGGGCACGTRREAGQSAGVTVLALAAALAFARRRREGSGVG